MTAPFGFNKICKKPILKTLLITLSVSLSIIGCNQKTEYQQTVERELTEEGRNDSLFLGYHFGMTKQEFFDHSWKLNNQKKVKDGNVAASIRYEVEGLKARAHKLFYPKFHEDKIYKMPVKYRYNGWAPWNRDYWADSLKVDLLQKFRKEYPNEFIEMEHPELGVPSHIMVDKNKRIAIYELNDEEVAVDYVDLTVLKDLKKEK